MALEKIIRINDSIVVDETISISERDKEMVENLINFFRELSKEKELKRGIYYSLFTIGTIINNAPKSEVHDAILELLNGNMPFYSERFLKFGRREYYFDRNGFSGNRENKNYKTKLALFNKKEPFDVFDYCSLK